MSGSGNHTTGYDWGMVYGSVLPTLEKIEWLFHWNMGYRWIYFLLILSVCYGEWVRMGSFIDSKYDGLPFISKMIFNNYVKG